MLLATCWHAAWKHVDATSPMLHSGAVQLPKLRSIAASTTRRISVAHSRRALASRRVCIVIRPRCTVSLVDVRWSNRSRPTLPNVGITSSMEDGKHNHGIPAKSEIDCERKTARNGPSDVTEHDRVACRTLCYFCECLVDLACKFFAESVALTLVPDCCILELGSCCPSKDNAEGHRPSRTRTDVLISSHEATSSGNLSSSATRWFSSVR